MLLPLPGRFLMKYFSDSLAIFPVMALVNITTILADTQRILKKIKPPGCIELLSDKRNRGIAIIKREEQLLVPYRTISCFFCKEIFR